uniref:Uncharacterized protein n=1 Tax=Triticum urartu TaxID=4572 RepID=A0A8R7R5B4_TRIUA
RPTAITPASSDPREPARDRSPSPASTTAQANAPWCPRARARAAEAGPEALPASTAAAAAAAWLRAWPCSPSASPGSGRPTSPRASSRRRCKHPLSPPHHPQWRWLATQRNRAEFAGFSAFSPRLRSTKRFGPEERRFDHLAFLNFAQNVVCFVWSFISEHPRAALLHFPPNAAVASLLLYGGCV